MPLDPQVRAVLEQLAKLNLPAYETLTPQEARAQAEAMRPPVQGEPVAKVEDTVAPGPAGDIPVRVYTPEGNGPFPALVFYHGGGWVIGSIAGSDVTCRQLANGAGCVVVSVDYRLAPEHKFPAAAEDSYAAVRWVAQNAAALNVDPDRIAVGGVSAGGNLAAVVSLMAKERGGPKLVHQLLVVPVTNHAYDTASYTENAEGYQLTKGAMVWFWNHYLNTPSDGVHPYASPLQADDLSGLPPALVLTAEYDPLRDEGAAYAERLRAAGVPVTYTCCEGLTHAFFGMSAAVDRSRQAVADATAALRAAFVAKTPA